MVSCHFTKPHNTLLKLTPDGASYSSLRGWNNLKARQELVVLLSRRKCRQDRLSKQESTRQKKDAGEGENARLEEEETQLALLTMFLPMQLHFELDIMTKL